MKIVNKFKDLFDVIKYRRQRNTALNKYYARNEDYIELLETVPQLTKEILELQKQVKKLKEEKKEIKRIIEEDMTPKKNRKK